ncbi:hypothetical protein [Thiohalorhabdus methylotrophus]|uniref:Uncharacterized protein n=1 Tax=Thiohalorhabdus methylotrophus TaxID=3242694 RepID=A0ABV4TTJ8_9GAMM
MRPNVLEMSITERLEACRELQAHTPGAAQADCDECAEYRQAVCNFPDWLGYPYEVEEERISPER